MDSWIWFAWIFIFQRTAQACYLDTAVRLLRHIDVLHVPCSKWVISSGNSWKQSIPSQAATIIGLITVYWEAINYCVSLSGGMFWNFSRFIFTRLPVIFLALGHQQFLCLTPAKIYFDGSSVGRSPIELFHLWSPQLEKGFFGPPLAGKPSCVTLWASKPLYPVYSAFENWFICGL